MFYFLPESRFPVPQAMHCARLLWHARCPVGAAPPPVYCGGPALRTRPSFDQVKEQVTKVFFSAAQKPDHYSAQTLHVLSFISLILESIE